MDCIRGDTTPEPGRPDGHRPGGLPAATGARGRSSGEQVAVPVEVRRAAQWSVQYLVPAAAAQRLVSPTGLEVTGPFPGRALMALAACRYDDTDLGPYHEVAVSFVVRRARQPSRGHRGPAPSGAGHRGHRCLHPPAPGGPGVQLRRRPGHLGVPQVGDLDRDRRARPGAAGAGTGTSVRLVDGGIHVLTLSVSAGGRLRLPAQAPPTYSFADGVLRLHHVDHLGGGDRRPGRRSDPGPRRPPDGRRAALARPASPCPVLLLTAQMRASFDAAEVVTPRGR